VFIEAKDDGSGGENWSYKSCKAPAISSPPTNQHPVSYRPDALPVAQPTVSKQCQSSVNPNLANAFRYALTLVFAVV